MSYRRAVGSADDVKQHGELVNEFEDFRQLSLGRDRGPVPARDYGMQTSPNALVLFAEDGRGVAQGILLGMIVKRMATIHLLFLRAEFRRCGAGTGLVTRFSDWAATKPVDVEHVLVDSENNGAIAFYRGLGFRPVGLRAGDPQFERPTVR
jgi:ribosomal protein S18 acetylase RimI-like enzyme